MACIVDGLKSDEICTEDTLEERLSDGKTAEDLRGRKSHVEEETNRSLGSFGVRAEEGRKQHEVIIIYPDWRKPGCQGVRRESKPCTH